MIPDDDIFEKIEMDYDFRRDGNLLEITPVLELDAPDSMTLIASFFVDSFELVESARFSVQKGKNTIPFRQRSRIFNPLIWYPHTHGEPAMYELKTVFYKNGRAHFVIVHMTGLKQVELRRECGRHRLFVNGSHIPCRYHEFQPEAEASGIGSLCREYGFNFTIVRGTEETAEKMLDYCDRIGIAVALDLTELSRTRYRRLALHPSVCLHTAQQNECRMDASVPFLTLEEIKTSLLKQGD